MDPSSVWASVWEDWHSNLPESSSAARSPGPRRCSQAPQARSRRERVASTARPPRSLASDVYRPQVLQLRPWGGLTPQRQNSGGCCATRGPSGVARCGRGRGSIEAGAAAIQQASSGGGACHPHARRVGGLVCNAAHAANLLGARVGGAIPPAPGLRVRATYRTLLAQQADVAVLAVRRRPRVAHEPVVEPAGIVGAVALQDNDVLRCAQPHPHVRAGGRHSHVGQAGATLARAAPTREIRRAGVEETPRSGGRQSIRHIGA